MTLEQFKERKIKLNKMADKWHIGQIGIDRFCTNQRKTIIKKRGVKIYEIR